MAKVVLIALFDEWCFGLRQLQAILKQHGHTADLVFVRGMEDIGVEESVEDEGYACAPAFVTARELDLLYSFIAERKPLVVGLGHTSNFTGLAAHIVAQLRARLPETTFLAGGVEATVNPELALDSFDYVCRGEGDDFIVPFIEHIEQKQDLSDLPNLAWRDKNEQLHLNAIAPTISDLDRLPPMDFSAGDKFLIRDNTLQADALPPNSFLHYTYATMTGRGCPFRCTYCCNAVYANLYEGQYLRRHSVDYVMRELTAYLARNPHIQGIDFYDDVFTINPKWLNEFSAAYAEQIRLPFHCYTYPVLVKREILVPLKKAGLATLWMGLQSGSERVLDEVYERKGTHEQVIEAVRLINELGIDLQVDLIGTSALETTEDKHATIDLLTRMPRTYRISKMGPLSFYPHYPIIEKASQAGIVLRAQPGRNVLLADERPLDQFYNSLATLCQFPELSRETIFKLEQCEELKANVPLLQALEHALELATFVNASRMHKDFMIQELARRIEDLEEKRKSHRAAAINSPAKLQQEMIAPAFEDLFRKYGDQQSLSELKDIALFNDEMVIGDLRAAFLAGTYFENTSIEKDFLIEQLNGRLRQASAQQPGRISFFNRLKSWLGRQESPARNADPRRRLSPERILELAGFVE